MTGGITVVVADDHPVTRAGTISMLQQMIGLNVIGEGADGLEALELCRTLHPQLLLLDVRLPKMEGLMVVHLVSHNYQAPRIIMFSAFANKALVKASLDAGANGYLLKSASGAELFEAIQRVMQGQQVLLGVEKPQESKRPSLSGQELTTLQYIAGGMSTREIASQMSSSTRTIETYLNRIFFKLGANNRTQAVMIAQREQLLSADERMPNSERA